jgi:hypothetical protein
MGSSTHFEQGGTMSSHYHVATGLAGYGPDASDTDGFATFDTLGSALDYARDELATFIEMAHEGSHAAADAGDYEQAWLEVCRVETLDTLRANLDPSRKQAPLYVDDDAAYAALQETQAADFPHDVSHNARLYLWECDEPDCESAADDDDDTPDDDDAFITDTPRGYSVSFAGKFVGEYAERDDAERAVSEAMHAGNFWPNVWLVNDHGNVDLVTIEQPKRCGAWKAETHEDRGPIDCGCGWGAYCELSSEYVGSEGERFGLEQARALLDGTAGYETRQEPR